MAVTKRREGYERGGARNDAPTKFSIISRWVPGAKFLTATGHPIKKGVRWTPSLYGRLCAIGRRDIITGRPRTMSDLNVVNSL